MVRYEVRDLAKLNYTRTAILRQRLEKLADNLLQQKPQILRKQLACLKGFTLLSTVNSVYLPSEINRCEAADYNREFSLPCLHAILHKNFYDHRKIKPCNYIFS